MKKWLLLSVVTVLALGVVAAGCGGSGDATTPEEALAVLQNLSDEELQELRDSGALTDLLGAMTGRNAAGTGQRPTGMAGAGGAGGMAVGTILDKDADSLTIETSDGGSRIVFYSDSTEVSISEEGTTSDLATGETVSVTGATNDDGTMTASRIQVVTGIGGGDFGAANPPTSAE